MPVKFVARVLACLLITNLLAACFAANASAQSLKPAAPAPLQPGLNKSTIDSMVGAQYWYFNAGPGEVRLHVLFQSMGLFGNANNCNVTFALYDEGRSWRTEKVLSSSSKSADYTFIGQIKRPTKVILSVNPPANTLIRMGGHYELEAAGPISYGAASSADPVVRVYKQMGGYTKLLGNCKFLADGTIKTTEGAAGLWKLFDRDSNTYVIDIDGEARHSLQYMPGRGLVDGDSIVFQEMQ